MPRRTMFLLAALVLIAAACDGSDSEVAPSGSLGPVTADAAEIAVGGLCEIAIATDRSEADATFQDLSHQTLHVIAAATEVVDRSVAADLLEAKQRVEADLAGTTLPAAFNTDVVALLDATRVALDVIGLDVPDCLP